MIDRIHANEIQPKNPSYLLKPYIAKEVITLWVGADGVGKTTVLNSLAAAITRGDTEWHGSPLTTTTRKVCILTSENDPAGMIVPQLTAANAVLENVVFPGDSVIGNIFLGSQNFKDFICENNPDLVVVDPIQSFVGSNVNMRRTNEMRPILDTTGGIASECQCSIVLVSHINRKGLTVRQAIMESSDLSNKARSVVFAANDPETGIPGVLAHYKNSYGQLGKSMRFLINTVYVECEKSDGKREEIETGKVEYLGECKYTADELLGRTQMSVMDSGTPVLRQEGKVFVLTSIEGNGGQIYRSELLEGAAGSGVSKATVVRAIDDLLFEKKICKHKEKRFAFYTLPVDDKDNNDQPVFEPLDDFDDRPF